MNQLREKTIAEIVTEDFRAAGIFEKYDLDFCCNGKRKLEDVCSNQDVSVELIVSELNLLSTSGRGAPRFNTWTSDFLIDYIVKNHHAYVREASERLLFYTQKIANRHGSNHPEFLKIADLFDALAGEMQSHMHKEEYVLFPYIEALQAAAESRAEIPAAAFGSVLHPIEMMESEHESAGDLTHQIRQLTNNYTVPEDVCMSCQVTYQELQAFERDLHEHVHLENNILFPKALAIEESLKVQMQ